MLPTAIVSGLIVAFVAWFGLVFWPLWLLAFPAGAAIRAMWREILDRGGNHQVNAAIHRIAVTRARCHPETRTYLDRKRAEGKSAPKKPVRCLKRHLARRIWHLLQTPHPIGGTPPSPSIS